jgi:para-nitrobenzyl esterase
LISTWQSAEQASRYAAALVSQLGLGRDGIDRIQNLPFEAVADAAWEVQQKDRTLAILPTVDGTTVPEAPFNPAPPQGTAHVPLMLGTTMRETGPIVRPMQKPIDDEAVRRLAAERYGARATEVLAALMAAFPDAEPVDLLGHIQWFESRNALVRQAQIKAAQHAAPAYVYLFTWRTQVFGGTPRAFHGSEVPFVFDNADLCAPMTCGTDEARTLADRMSGAWVSFARTGNPNHPGLPSWPMVTTQHVPTLVFDNHCALRVDHDALARSLTA